MPHIIDVFLMFKPTERNGRTFKSGAPSTVESGPNWSGIQNIAAHAGYKVVLHGPSTTPSISEVNDSMQNAEVTLFIGHGHGTTDHSDAVPKWVSNRIKLADGTIQSPGGVFQGRWTNDGFIRDSAGQKVALKNVTGIFTCNSFSKMPDAFDQKEGSHLITNDGGSNGLTRVGTLEAGAAAFVQEYVRTKGNVASGMARAQRVFVAHGAEWESDKGDKLHDTVGVAPPPPLPGVPAPAAPAAPGTAPGVSTPRRVYGPTDD